MIKVVCDICGTRPADNRFKVKKEIATAFIDAGLAFPIKEWVDIDICEECYQKLFSKASVKESNQNVYKT